MSIISIIVAVDEKNAIGKNNRLLCHLPNDLRYFKKVTEGHTVIMGRNTYQSLPNGALPNRRNIVITSNKHFEATNCEIVGSLEQALELCKDEQEVFVIGGAMLYREAVKIADKLYITYINHTFEGADTYFPNFDLKIWNKISSIENPADEKNKYAHNFTTYIKAI